MKEKKDIFSFRVDKNILKEFKDQCDYYNLKAPEVLQSLMMLFITTEGEN